MSDNQHEITLREAEPGNPSELLDRIKDAIDELFDCGVSSAGDYVKGKSSQEVAKASEIKAKAFAHLANLDLERQRLISERDKALAEDRQKMYELKTQRLQAVVNSLIKLKQMGVEIQIDVIDACVSQLIRSVEY